MEITANSAQLVASGDNILYTETPICGNCSILHREGSGLVTLRGLSNNQPRARFRVFFNGNVAIPVGTSATSIQVAVAINGEKVNPTLMIATPSDNGYWNISSATFIDVPAGNSVSISVKNVSTIGINVANANLIVERVA